MRTRLLLLAALLAAPAAPRAAETPADYAAWLEGRSMLSEASSLAAKVSGSGGQWRSPYALPQSGAFLDKASVWFTAYPNATITNKGESIIGLLGGADLWKQFGRLGVRAMHTGPLKLAGSVDGRSYGPTIDGWFDRIGFSIDPAFGTEAEYRAMVRNAADNGAMIIGDIIPGHTGKGPDFRLAEMGYKDYPGLYDMVEIKKEDWGLLPAVPAGADSANLPYGTVDKLTGLGYIPGHLQRVLFSVPGKKVTGWDATPEIAGADGRTRRWVYLHYFKPGQPTLNWADPSFAAQRLLAADMVKTRLELGAGAIRLDANPFLGIERRPGTYDAWSEGHPLSVGASNYIAWLARKLGAFSFQELNLGLEEISAFSVNGPDLSYDFVTRPAYDDALLTGDAEFLRLTLRLMDRYGIKPGRLIHAMQNHDEITYELVHFLNHPDEKFQYYDRELTGAELRKLIVDRMHALAIGPQAPFNRLSGNGLCATYTGLAATALGIRDVYAMTPEQKEQVKRAHLLLAMYNAMQPGVFAVSGWDLVGALPLKPGQIPGLLADGDCRWLNRGAYDLTGERKADASAGGLPRAQTLYGDLPSQFRDPDSFASRLAGMLEVRRKYGLDKAERLDVLETDGKGTVALAHRLPGGEVEITALNFSREETEESLPVGEYKASAAADLLGREPETKVEDGMLPLKLGPLEGRVLLLRRELSGDSKKEGGS